jgi:hypothetical protein
MEKVRNRFRRTGNLKVLSWQQLTDIGSRRWNNVNQETFVRAFELTGTNGVAHLNFLSHQSKLSFLSTNYLVSIQAYQSQSTCQANRHAKGFV